MPLSSPGTTLWGRQDPDPSSPDKRELMAWRSWPGDMAEG